MPIDEFIINIYLMVEQYYKIVITQPLRGAGYAPKLSDPEIICMEMVGEFYTLIKTNKFGNTLPSIGKTGFQPSAHTLTSQSTAPICGKSNSRYKITSVKLKAVTTFILWMAFRYPSVIMDALIGIKTIKT